MQRRFLMTALALLLTGCGMEPGTPPSATVSGTSSPSSSAPAASTMPVAAPHPVSLDAFAAKTFDGRDFTLGRVLASNAAYTRYYVTYKSGELTISGILNIPAGDGPHPLLVLNHGYIDPAIYTNGRGLKREQDYLARRGYAVLHSDYRNHAESSKDPDTELSFRLGYAEDVINGILALRAAKLPTIDAERVGMMGHSMGGGVTQVILVTRPDLVDAAMLYAAVSGDARENFKRWTVSRPETAEKILDLYGAPEEDPSFWDGISPRTRLDRITAPVLIEHGTADKDVPVAWSDDLDEALRALGKDVTYHVYPGEPHEFAAAWPTVMERTAAFFDEHVKAEARD